MSMRAVKLSTPALVTVAAAGTPVQLESKSGGEAHSVIVQALGTNEGTIVVGDKNVKAAPGIHGAPTRRGIALAANESVAIDIADPGAIWIDSTINGDGVTFMMAIA
jgi:hypothetical protein